MIFTLTTINLQRCPTFIEAIRDETYRELPYREIPQVSDRGNFTSQCSSELFHSLSKCSSSYVVLPDRPADAILRGGSDARCAWAGRAVRRWDL